VKRAINDKLFKRIDSWLRSKRLLRRLCFFLFGAVVERKDRGSDEIRRLGLLKARLGGGFNSEVDVPPQKSRADEKLMMIYHSVNSQGGFNTGIGLFPQGRADDEGVENIFLFRSGPCRHIHAAFFTYFSAVIHWHIRAPRRGRRWSELSNYSWGVHLSPYRCV